jgi:hypothetical protein
VTGFCGFPFSDNESFIAIGFNLFNGFRRFFAGNLPAGLNEKTSRREKISREVFAFGN